MPRKRKTPKGYDSRLEADLHKKELKKLTYHPQEKIRYVTTHYYEPDFFYETPERLVYIEVKGYFRTRSEASKYIAVKETFEHEEQEKQKELIFVFQDANKPMPNAKKRKDGTKQTMGEWATNNNIRYACLKREGVPRWLKTCSLPKKT